jgi:hypothetical protein
MLPYNANARYTGWKCFDRNAPFPYVASDWCLRNYARCETSTLFAEWRCRVTCGKCDENSGEADATADWDEGDYLPNPFYSPPPPPPSFPPPIPTAPLFGREIPRNRESEVWTIKMVLPDIDRNIIGGVPNIVKQVQKEFIDDVGCAQNPGCSDEGKGVTNCDIAPSCQVRVQIGDVPGYWEAGISDAEDLKVVENGYGMTWKRMEPAFMEEFRGLEVGCTAQTFDHATAYELCYAEPKCTRILMVGCPQS